MTITLPREQQEWLEAQVKAGFYDSVDEARASIARGEGMTLDEYRARVDERFGKLERRWPSWLFRRKLSWTQPPLSRC